MTQLDQLLDVIAADNSLLEGILRFKKSIIEFRLY